MVLALAPTEVRKQHSRFFLSIVLSTTRIRLYEFNRFTRNRPSSKDTMVSYIYTVSSNYIYTNFLLRYEAVNSLRNFSSKTNRMMRHL